MKGGETITAKEKAFVKKARKRMIDLDMNTAALAEKLGISKPYMSMLLSGTRRMTDEIKGRIKEELKI